MMMVVMMMVMTRMQVVVPALCGGQCQGKGQRAARVSPGPQTCHGGKH